MRVRKQSGCYCKSEISLLLGSHQPGLHCHQICRWESIALQLVQRSVIVLAKLESLGTGYKAISCFIYILESTVVLSM